MTSTPASSSELQKSLSKLSLSSMNPSAPKSIPQIKKTKSPVADSWEELAESDDSGEETDRPLAHQQSSEFPSAPPPTPISPSVLSNVTFGPGGVPISNYDGPSDGAEKKRPAKSVATAERLIRNDLGLGRAKKTEEQKEYEAAVRKKEKARIEQEKEEKRRGEEEREKAKKAIWDE